MIFFIVPLVAVQHSQYGKGMVSPHVNLTHVDDTSVLFQSMSELMFCFCSLEGLLGTLGWF